MNAPDMRSPLRERDVAHHAELAWMGYPARGLRVCKTYNLEASLPEDANFLRRLWGDLYIQGGSMQRQ